MEDRQSPALPAPPLALVRKTNVKAIVALVAGIVGVTFLPLIGSIIALVFGYLAKREIDGSDEPQDGRPQAIAGIVLGWIALAIGVAFVVMFWLMYSVLDSV